ncbi:MAG TPA: ABC transporter permease [Thermoleophilaceae bacterium]|nr:ABC transporter permease [Thermoleophilaceae bacterium]
MSPAAMAWAQFRLERRLFWRSPTAAFFNFVLPLLLLVLVASVFSSDAKELDVLVPGIAGMSVMATTFNALAFNLTALRELGILKRVQGTPMPAASYLAGLLGSAVANAFVQIALVVVIGHLAYGVDWPHNWAALAGFTALGVTCFGSLGIAFSHAIPSSDAAPAYVNAVFLPVIFISGVFYSSDDLPAFLDGVARALPLKHVIDGLSGAIVGGSVDMAGAAGVVVAWTALGVLLAVRGFRWE